MTDKHTPGPWRAIGDETIMAIHRHESDLITFPDDECAVECITLDKVVLRLCASKDNMPGGEHVLYPAGGDQ